MRAIIDIRALVPERSGGIIQNIIGVVRELLSKAGSEADSFIITCTIFNRHLIETHLGNAQIFTLPLHCYHDALQALAQKHGVDVIFHSYPRSDAITGDLSRHIFYIPDIQHEYFPQFFTATELRDRRAAFDPVLARAGAIGTISAFARSTLLEQPECTCDDIFLMPPALQVEHQDKPEASLSQAEAALIPNEPFLFFPANLWPHKNHRNLLAALRLLQAEGRAIRLVLTGSQAGWPALRNEFAHLPITHLGYVSAALVGSLMRRAEALVFFSLYEGFGIPLLEAFAAGTPVVCSNGTSLPEVGGDAALYANPEDPAEIAASIRSLLDDPARRQVLIDNGHKRLTHYSWRKSADNLLAAMHRVTERTTAPDSSEASMPADHKPLVSIITPSFNQGQFIAETIESVLQQSYPNIELIVMDGGSTDDTVAVLRRYDGRIQWFSEPDKGQAHAINKGMHLARGEIVAYLNSDDILLPNAVAEAVAFFNANPAVDLVYGEAEYIDSASCVTGRYRTTPYTPSALVYDCVICQPAAFWRRRVIRQIGLFDEALQFTMDYDYWLRLRNAGGVFAHAPQTWARSRLHADAKTVAQRRKIFPEIFEICRRHLGFVAIQYFEGYWHHHLIERHKTIGPLIGLFPSIWRSLARLHRLIYFAEHGLLRQTIAGKLRYKAQLGSRATQRLLRLYGWFRRLGKVGPATERIVLGFWADNWLSRQVVITAGQDLPARRIFLSGMAPKSGRITVTLNRKELLHQDVIGCQRSHMAFDLPAMAKGAKLELLIAECDYESGGRELALLLDATNLFTEFDTFVN